MTPSSLLASHLSTTGETGERQGGVVTSHLRHWTLFSRPVGSLISFVHLRTVVKKIVEELRKFTTPVLYEYLVIWL